METSHLPRIACVDSLVYGLIPSARDYLQSVLCLSTVDADAWNPDLHRIPELDPRSVRFRKKHPEMRETEDVGRSEASHAHG